jgi:hypothetical protein
MLGAIMPEPLAIPTISISAFSILHFLFAIFGNVSVVLIALAASNQFGSLYGDVCFKLSITLSESSCSPITPVEAV